MEYLKAFLCGGVLCLIGQILIDKTPLTGGVTSAAIFFGFLVALIFKPKPKR